MDSMGHNLEQAGYLQDTEIQYRRGATIWSTISQIQTDKLIVKGFAVVVVAVGTNDFDADSWVGSREAAEHASCKMHVMEELLAEIKRHNPSAYIILCSVLPRPCDDVFTNEVLKMFNRRLRSYAFGNRMGYEPTWTSFVEKKPSPTEQSEPLWDMYTSRNLHLNKEGARRLYDRFRMALSKAAIDTMAARSVPPFEVQWTSAHA